MCRLLIFAGRSDILMADLLTRPAHSIINQSYDSRLRVDLQRPLNADGFGVAFYLSEEEHRKLGDEQHASQADLDYLLRRTRSKSLRSRKASQESITVVTTVHGNGLGQDQKRVFESGVNQDGSLSQSQAELEPHSTHSAKVLGHYSHPQAPCIFTSTVPAWNNTNLIRLSEKIRTKLLFAHVRAASSDFNSQSIMAQPPPIVSESNCHPWNYGPIMFMHNGYINNFQKFKKVLINDLCDELYLGVKGNTDSEYAFALYLQILFDGDPEGNKDRLKKGGFSAEELADAMVKTIARINKYCLDYHRKVHGDDLSSFGTSLLNFGLTDGETVIATRYVNHRENEPASLYYSTGSAFEQCSPGVYKMQKSQRRENVCIISSEPLTYECRDWMSVPANTMIILDTRWFNLKVCPIQDEYWSPIASRKSPALKQIEVSDPQLFDHAKSPLSPAVWG
ncbi:hypothetical protein MP228_006353 [Amoeboaphelidium protococcarum]|nr:hypothetical protein MP228_006353 [Amoeboaphelidium protococcarum]